MTFTRPFRVGSMVETARPLRGQTIEEIVQRVITDEFRFTDARSRVLSRPDVRTS